MWTFDKCLQFDTYPDVTLSGEKTFWDSGRIQTGTSDVHGAHQIKPTHLSDCGGLYESFLDGEVHGGDNATKSKTHEHAWAK